MPTPAQAQVGPGDEDRKLLQTFLRRRRSELSTGPTRGRAGIQAALHVAEATSAISADVKDVYAALQRERDSRAGADDELGWHIAADSTIGFLTGVQWMREAQSKALKAVKAAERVDPELDRPAQARALAAFAIEVMQLLHTRGRNPGFDAGLGASFQAGIKALNKGVGALDVYRNLESAGPPLEHAEGLGWMLAQNAALGYLRAWEDLRQPRTEGDRPGESAGAGP